VKVMVLLLAVACGMPLRGWSQDPDAHAASRVIALENAWSRAAESKDLRSLDVLLDDSFVYVDFEGRLMRKTEVMADVKASAVQQFVTSEMTAHLYGNATIVTGTFRMKGIEKGKPFLLQGRFTDIWIYRGGNWACVASQATSIGH
jgi:ketosteroid isomerase-like protein